MKYLKEVLAKKVTMNKRQHRTEIVTSERQFFSFVPFIHIHFFP